MIDVVAAAGILVLTAPLTLVIALLIRHRLGSPVLFRQERVGHNEKIFRIKKFRTMSYARDEAGRLLPDEQRTPWLGLMLRKYSLDELPQLLNVLSGEMSLIGPRPLLVRYLPRYSPEQRLRHLVRPGITGWAQVHGRTTLQWDERLAYDVDYVRKMSLWLDLKILWQTVWHHMRDNDALGESPDDVGEFWGNQKPPVGGSRIFIPTEENASDQPPLDRAA